MRFLFVPILLFASTAFAQAIDPVANFPAEAITAVKQPRVPGAPDSGKPAAVPASPASPEQPVLDVWPANTVPVFLLACTQGNVKLIAPCKCTIEQLMHSMKHSEFMAISAKNTVAQDIRYTAARQQCAMKAQQSLQKK